MATLEGTEDAIDPMDPMFQADMEAAGPSTFPGFDSSSPSRQTVPLQQQDVLAQLMAQQQASRMQVGKSCAHAKSNLAKSAVRLDV